MRAAMRSPRIFFCEPLDLLRLSHKINVMSDLKTGMKVIHPMFGTGTIRAISGSGADAKITVDFSGAVGQKKLLAGVANLTPIGESGSSAPQPTKWFERVCVECKPKPGRRPVFDRVYEAIHSEIVLNEFWIAVRERMRAKGLAPKVLDDISGQISISVSEPLQIDICIKHAELIRPADQQLAISIFEVISQRLLIDFDAHIPTPAFGVSGELVEEDVITLSDEDLSNLPDRSPKRRPLPVTPKGVIKSRPKRRDDY